MGGSTDFLEGLSTVNGLFWLTTGSRSSLVNSNDGLGRDEEGNGASPVKVVKWVVSGDGSSNVGDTKGLHPKVSSSPDEIRNTKLLGNISILYTGLYHFNS